MFGVLVSCELEESYMAPDINKGIISLGVSKTELDIWNAWEAPGRPVFNRKLGRDPKFEDFRLALKFVVVFAVVDGRETGDVYLPTVVILADALGEEVAGPRDIKNLVSGLDFGSFFVP